MHAIQHFAISLVLAFVRAALPGAEPLPQHRGSALQSQRREAEAEDPYGQGKLVGEEEEGKSLLALGYPFEPVTGEQHPKAPSAACTKRA